jgi:tetratricopeptide (TPR) repeat protein
MTEPPDRSASRAVLIGVANYTHPHISELPAAATNLEDLLHVLTSPDGGGFTEEHCTIVTDPSTGTEIGTAVGCAAREATDVLLLYYAGHGLLDRRGRLHIALTGTDPDPSWVGWTSVPFAMLREEILESPARARILILDCCFSGRAFEAMSDEPGIVAGQTDIRGTYTIVSSEANETSFAPLGHRNTAFTAALLSAAKTPLLTLDDLYRATVQRLLRDGHPRPQRRSIDIAGDLCLFGVVNEEQHYRQAANKGDTDAAYNLARLLEDRGEAIEAETWARRAAQTGHPPGMNLLALMLEDRGDTTEAETWYRKAIDAGHTGAMFGLALMLEDRGDTTEAETWYRKAADAGDVTAMYNLALNLENQWNGSLAEAEAWYRKAADAGDTVAIYRLAQLLERRGKIKEAEAGFRRSIAAGHSNAMYNLAHLLKKQGKLDEAETWFRRAAARIQP